MFVLEKVSDSAIPAQPGDDEAEHWRPLKVLPTQWCSQGWQQL